MHDPPTGQSRQSHSPCTGLVFLMRDFGDLVANDWVSTKICNRLGVIVILGRKCA